MLDRRTDERHITDLMANYSYTPHSFFNRNTDEIKSTGLIKDMSCGGIKLTACEDLNKRSKVFFELSLANLDIHIGLSGKVMWVKRYNDTVSCGVKLDWVSDKETYLNYIKMLEEADKLF